MARLQDRLDEYKKSFESGAPPYNAPLQVIETTHRATAELKASGIEDHALKVGEHAPNFTLFTQDHIEVSSTDLVKCEVSPKMPTLNSRPDNFFFQIHNGRLVNSTQPYVLLRAGRDSFERLHPNGACAEPRVQLPAV